MNRFGVLETGEMNWFVMGLCAWPLQDSLALPCLTVLVVLGRHPSHHHHRWKQSLA